MAYKFSLGTYRHSGSMVAEEGITVDSGGLTVTGSVSLPAGEIGTDELANSAVTVAKLAADAVETAKIKDANVTTAKIADLAVTNDKLAGSIANAKLAFSTISGISLGGTLGALSNAANGGLSDFSYTGAGAVGVALSASVAGAGLGFTLGVLDVKATGALAIKNDFVAISSSIAGSGLGFVASALGDVSILSVNVDASSIEIDSDSLRVKDSGVTTAKIADSAVTEAKLGASAVATAKIADSAVTEAKLGASAVATAKIADSAVTEAKLGASAVATAKIADSAVTNAKLAGSIENAKLVNSSVTVTAGSGLSGGGSVSLGGSVNLDVAVNSDALEISDDAVALKSTISGNRTFSGTVTVGGDLIVTGNTFSASVGTLLVEDSNIVIADGAVALSASQGFTIGAGLATFQVGNGSDTNSAFVSSLELKASKFIGAVEGSLADSIQTLTSAATPTASVVFCNAAEAAFTVTLPTAVSKSGQMLKIKKSEGGSNAVTVAASGSQTIDGVSSIVLESPFAAVMLVSNGSNWLVF